MARKKDQKPKMCECGKSAAKGRTICETCKSRAWREKNPIMFIWHNLKKSAKKRGYEFQLTKEYFIQFVLGSGLLENRGRSAAAFTIDRIKNHLGYTEGNIQILTKSQNTMKWHEESRLAIGSMENNVLMPGEKYNPPF